MTKRSSSEEVERDYKIVLVGDDVPTAQEITAIRDKVYLVNDTHQECHYCQQKCDKWLFCKQLCVIVCFNCAKKCFYCGGLSCRHGCDQCDKLASYVCIQTGEEVCAKCIEKDMFVKFHMEKGDNLCKHYSPKSIYEDGSQNDSYYRCYQPFNCRIYRCGDDGKHGMICQNCIGRCLVKNCRSPLCIKCCKEDVDKYDNAIGYSYCANCRPVIAAEVELKLKFIQISK
jgi:hypothetical protein